MVLKCEICNVTVPDERVLAEHDKGKKHQAIVAARQRYEYSQLSSIYVSRIKQHHNDEQLKNYFAQFGSIKDCFMDKEKHVYAIIEYENPESVERCLASGNEHKIQDDRLKVKARVQKPFQAKKMILSEQEFLKLNTDKEIEKHTQMVHALNNCSTVEEQAKLVVEYEKMADVDLRQCEQFYLELQNLFSKHFHDSKLNLTGSMANGLATVLSDMDLVLVLNDTYIEPQSYHQSYNSDDSIRSPINSNTNTENSNESKMDVENGNEKLAMRNNSSSNEASSSTPSPLSVIHSANELLQQSVADRLDYIGRLLRNHAPNVCHIQRICHARCPLVRFCHKQQKLFCELSINNHLAVCNTELIQLYLELEPNLRLLLYTLRLWAKQKDLFGKGTRFNTYTLFWMLVFVLQQLQRLPSVSMLVQLSANQRIHGPWNCSVPDVNQVKSVFQSVSGCTLEQMLQSFFSYYSSMDPVKYSVSVWSGMNSEVQQQPSSGCALLVQDPFEHSHNLSSHVSASNWLKFQQECRSAVQILTDYNKKRLNKAWGWCLLFTRKTLPKSNFKKKKNQTPTAQTQMNFNLNQLNITQTKMNEHLFHSYLENIILKILLFETVNLNEINKQRYDHEKSKNKRSVDKLAEIEITPNGLADQFNQTLGDSLGPPAKRPKSNANKDQASDEEDIDDDDDIQMAYSKVATTFKVTHETWKNRRRLKKNVTENELDVSTFLHEQMISEKLKQDQTSQIAEPLYFTMETTPTVTTGAYDVRFSLVSDEHQNQQHFSELAHFLEQFLPKILKDPSIMASIVR